TGVVTGQRELHISTKVVEQKPDVPRSAFNVLSRIVNISDSKPRRCWRHQLHQAARAFVRGSTSLETRFLMHDGIEQDRINSITFPRVNYEAIDFRIARRESIE